MQDVESIKELLDKSIRFLCCAYFMVRKDRYKELIFEAILEEAGLEPEECRPVEEFLESRSYIERRTADGPKGHFDITHSGFCYVEELILSEQVRVSFQPEPGEAEIDIREEILQEKQKRDAFIIQLYEAANGSKWQMVSITQLTEAMEITEQEAMSLAIYWVDEFLLERKSWKTLSLTEWGKAAVEQYLLESSAESTGAKSITRGPNQDTEYKLDELRQLREASKKNGEVTLGWMLACEQVGIRPETVKRHDIELRQRWGDATY